MKTILLIAGLTVAAGFYGAAAPLTESTFTEIINQVNTLAADGSASAIGRTTAGSTDTG